MALAYAGAGGAAIVLTLWDAATGAVVSVSAISQTDFCRNSVRDCIRLHVSLARKPRTAPASACGTRDSAYRFGDSDSRVLFRRRSIWLTLVLLVITAVGSYASKGPFWALSSEWLGPKVAAAGLAQINALGRLACVFL